ncbi:transmembrane protein 65-like [Diadema setosum]|uniref:transmembrane protein 65-like n=1 Tax=Diadema setosum TaxID=31175 RepID=UPI003B39FEC9
MRPCASNNTIIQANSIGSISSPLKNTLLSHVNPGFAINCRSAFTISSRRSRKLDTPKRSRDFISTLRRDERETLFEELLKYHNYKASLKSGIAAGNITSDLPQQPAAPLPTSQQLRLVAFSNALPFIGFGFFDNAIMIIAGDYIDMTIGAALSISTMAAAGMGNMISDVAGIGLAGTVEAAVSRVGPQVPELTPEQLDMNRTRWTASIARALGIMVGCLIGMFPLLFLTTKEDQEEKEAAT